MTHEPRINHLNKTVTTMEAEYLDPAVFAPPRGMMLNVLTIGGIQTKAYWQDDAGFIGWYPLIGVPTWAKERITKSYKEGVARKKAKP